jgi:hypothetical protein
MPGGSGRFKVKIKVRVIPNGCAVPLIAHAMTVRGTSPARAAGKPAEEAARRARAACAYPAGLH